MAIQTAVPNEIIAGDTARFTLDFGDYPAASWTLTFYAENNTGAFSAVASGSGTSFAWTISAATTAALVAGRYAYFIRATDGSIVETVQQGWVDVMPDPAAAGKIDRRSWARRTLDAVEATLEGRATADQLAMSVGGRSLSRTPEIELMQWRTQLRAEVRTEESANDAGLGRQIRVRLSR